MSSALVSKARNRLADRVRLIAKLCRYMDKSGRCSRTDVHELRRACRAAEAAAWLLSPASGATFEQFRACLKRLRRRAGAVRDVDVAQLVLKPLEEIGAMRAAAAVVRDSLKNVRRRRSKRLLRFLGEHPRGGIGRSARELLVASKDLADAEVRGSLRSLDSRVRRLAAGRPRSIEAIHTLRIAGKRALLAGDLVRPVPRESSPLAALVDKIGLLLDIQVTIELVRDELRDAFDASDPTFTRLLQALERQGRTERSRVIALCATITLPPRSRPRSVQ